MERLQRQVLKNMRSSNSTSSSSSSQPIMDAIPASLLDSFIPGFGIISRIFDTYFGIDLSRIVLTVFVLAAFLTALRQSRRAFNSFINDYLGANIIIESDDDLYQQVMDWISGNVVTENARELTATTKSTNPWSSQNNTSSTGIFNFKEFDARFPPSFVPAHGTHRFWFRGRVFWMYRERRNVQSRSSNPFAPVNKEEETIRLMTLGRRTAPIKRLLDECKSQAASKQRESTSVRYADTSRGTPWWRRAGQRPTRPLNTIYLDKDSKEDLLEDIQDFLHPSAWSFYSRRGIPYRRGYLFYGQPGTGKTSLSLALAGMFGLTLYMLSLSDSSYTDQNLSQLFATLPTSCVVLMEDIDTVAVSRKSDAEEEPRAKEVSKEGDDEKDSPQKGRFNKRNVGATQGITLSGLLNAIDGVASQEGRILVMTTNAPEALDPALIRPGRVDRQVYFGFLTKDCARQMFLTMFRDDEHLTAANVQSPENQASLDGTMSAANGSSQSPTDHHNKQLPRSTSNGQAKNVPEKFDLDQLAEEFVGLLPEASLTPAEVQGFLLTRRHNPKRAIREFDAWAKETLAAKAQGLNVSKQIDEAANPATSSTAATASAEPDSGKTASGNGPKGK